MIIGAFVMIALAQAPASSTTLSGQVVDADGRPAVSIEVMLSMGRGLWECSVYSRARSDRDGKFRIDVPSETDSRRTRFYLALWAHAPNTRLAGQALSPSALPAAGSVQLKLGSPAHTTVRVLGPDGKPVAGARVAPAWLHTAREIRPGSTVPLPDALADMLAARTDADGKGEIQGCRAEDIESVSVEAAGFGSQISELGASAGGVRAITLNAAGRLTGRVQVFDPAAARGLEVDALTRPRASAGLWPTARGRATTDAEGRFEIPALAAGKLHVNVLLAESVKLRPEATVRPHDRAGQDHRRHDPAGGPAARTDRGGPCHRSHRPAGGRCHRVPVR